MNMDGLDMMIDTAHTNGAGKAPTSISFVDNAAKRYRRHTCDNFLFFYIGFAMYADGWRLINTLVDQNGGQLASGAW